ncbi:MAG: hypothetical protein NZV14_04310 [Bryobacteraceae bacterium]|nr:hypothetical protein [Bryobacteraceae bacterium]MDW8377356.1 hypothetical protein [Bryobacterales bacterium]
MRSRPPSPTFGRLRIFLDPWQPEFGPEFSAFEEASEGEAETVDTERECDSKDWRPIDPPPFSLGEEPVWLIDGVRRLEARVTIENDRQYSQGAFGAYAVGAVHLSTQLARFERLVTGRVLALATGEQLPATVTLGRGLSYVPVRVAEEGPEAAVRAIHSEMRKCEEALAREVADHPGRLVIVDGPLTFEQPVRGAAVGYIKRVMRTYLGREHLAVLAQLQPSQRTPLFGLSGSQRFSRLSWFFRLSAPRRGDSEFSGIVRLEVAEGVGLERARELAGACSAILPQLKARRGLDLRAPQNLLPISALERHLRHRLGDERLVRRSIESFLMREFYASNE